MAQHLYSSFLDDASEYEAALRYWQELWESIDPLARTEHGWETPWFDNPLRDGNPIFSAISQSERKGLRIIQFPPSSLTVQFGAWFDTFGGPIWEKDSVAELVLACALSEEAAALSLDRVKQWIIGAVSTQQMHDSLVTHDFSGAGMSESVIQPMVA